MYKNNTVATYSTLAAADENNCVMMNENESTIERRHSTIRSLYADCQGYSYNIK